MASSVAASRRGSVQENENGKDSNSEEDDDGTDKDGKDSGDDASKNDDGGERENEILLPRKRKIATNWRMLLAQMGRLNTTPLKLLKNRQMCT